LKKKKKRERRKSKGRTVSRGGVRKGMGREKKKGALIRLCIKRNRGQKEFHTNVKPVGEGRLKGNVLNFIRGYWSMDGLF